METTDKPTDKSTDKPTVKKYHCQLCNVIINLSNKKRHDKSGKHIKILAILTD